MNPDEFIKLTAAAKNDPDPEIQRLAKNAEKAVLRGIVDDQAARGSNESRRSVAFTVGLVLVIVGFLLGITQGISKSATTGEITVIGSLLTAGVTLMVLKWG